MISSALTERRRQDIPADKEAAWLFPHFFRIARERELFRRSRARDTVKLLVASVARLVSAGRQSELRIMEAERRRMIALLAA